MCVQPLHHKCDDIVLSRSTSPCIACCQTLSPPPTQGVCLALRDYIHVGNILVKKNLCNIYITYCSNVHVWLLDHFTLDSVHVHVHVHVRRLWLLSALKLSTTPLSAVFHSCALGIFHHELKYPSPKLYQPCHYIIT